MQAFDVLGSPVRRRILELLAERARTSGEIVEAIQRDFDISQPGVSQHLSVLRETGFATSRRTVGVECTRSAPMPFGEVEAWLDRLRGVWNQRLDALATEVARGKRERRLQRAKEQPTAAAPRDDLADRVAVRLSAVSRHGERERRPMLGVRHREETPAMRLDNGAGDR